MRIIIIGNSGSGKTTLARRLTTRHTIPLLELDAIVWEPNQIAVPRSLDLVKLELQSFMDSSASWVIEGCYGELATTALPFCTELIFMNPGLAVCLANNRRRPWEPEKYASPEAQNERLVNLLAWVEGYYARTDEWSYNAHRRVFDGFSGVKREVTSLSELEQ
ncbi:MAG: shikimate kinase [Acidobacteria bacterium]|nr:shikimate kinase [Acidobacteriota bacterium]MBI3423719.1 shikimate kinase [Acidobacteriota bacterium]